MQRNEGDPCAGRVWALPLLSAAECGCVCDKVYELRHHWIPRPRPPSHFHTLGLNAYMDLGEPELRSPGINYYRDSPRFSALLSDSFDWLHRRVRDALEHYLRERATYETFVARPGFHIFESPAIPTGATSSEHFDLQYERIDWPPDSEIDRASTISFTLPVCLPAAGGGIWVWDLTYAEMSRAVARGYVTSIDEMKRFKVRTEHRYGLGQLHVHSGHFLHQIAPVARVEPGENRITLQGHAIRCAGRWILYW